MRDMIDLHLSRSEAVYQTVDQENNGNDISRKLQKRKEVCQNRQTKIEVWIHNNSTEDNRTYGSGSSQTSFKRCIIFVANGGGDITNQHAQ